MNRVAIYIRVSTVFQVDKDSLPMQRQDLISYSKLLLGTEDYEIFEDAGYSAKNTDRPAFKAMMQKIRNKAFTHLLVWKIDRISRNLLDFSKMYAELKSLGVTFVSKNEQFDTSTAMGEAMLKIILVFAELERNITSERVTATMISRATNGLWNGGNIAYGYKYDKEKHEFSIDEEKAKVIRLIHDKYEELGSPYHVTRYLNSTSYMPAVTSTWDVQSVTVILLNRFYCGEYIYNKRSSKKNSDNLVTIKDHHPAIISVEQKDRIMNSFNRKKIHPNDLLVSSGYVNIFGGLVFCKSCGKVLTASRAAFPKRGAAYTRYKCRRAAMDGSCDNKISTSDYKLGDFIFNFIINMLNAQKKGPFSSTDELQKALLHGTLFKEVESIDQESLSDVLRLYSASAQKVIYSNNLLFEEEPPEEESNEEVESLKQAKMKLDRALDRLRTIYLYDEESMPEAEYRAEHKRITDKMAEINDKIGMISSQENTISDEAFIRKSSDFIVTTCLDGRNFISFEWLMKNTSTNALRGFVISVVDNIVNYQGRIVSLTLKNGVSFKFTYKEKAPVQPG